MHAVPMNGRRQWSCGLLAAAALGIGILWCTPAAAEPDQSAPSSPLRIGWDDGYLQFGIEAGIQAVGEDHAYWDLSHRFAPGSRFRTTLGWAEGYAKPSIAFEHKFGGVTLYGGVSALASGTLARDVFDTGNRGMVLLEDGFVGLRAGTPGQGLFMDVSAGPQSFRIGSGMLIADGGGDGFERGAVVFGPRRAWQMTGIGRVGYGPFSITGFYLDANELHSGDTNTKLAGANAEVALGKNQSIGAAFGQALSSTAPYPRAAPGGNGAPAVLPDARDGLRFVNLYGRWNPFTDLPGLWIAGDLALEWNDRINMRAWGGRAELGHAFDNLPFRPVLSYAWQTFSGDKPGTRRLERFDPLFYDGSPGGWSTGSNGSFVFINSNVNAHRLSLAITASPQDFITLRYAHVRASELNSPIQFGQATRLTNPSGAPALIAGVRHGHLSDDFLLEYTHALSANMFLTGGVAHSIPGAGLNDLMHGHAPSWTGGFANLVVRY